MKELKDLRLSGSMISCKIYYKQRNNSQYFEGKLLV